MNQQQLSENFARSQKDIDAIKNPEVRVLATIMLGEYKRQAEFGMEPGIIDLAHAIIDSGLIKELADA